MKRTEILRERIVVDVSTDRPLDVPHRNKRLGKAPYSEIDL